ncbi:MAG: hypothetical protein GXY50_09390 [Syntrophomonadaceae bacterium]|nr:hypothetical protein [Syntrophomonadaceae bacterium]
MNCPEADKLLEHYLDLEDIPSEQCQQVKAHAEECPACQDKIDYAVRERNALCFEGDIPALDAAFTSKVMSAIKQEHPPKPASWLSRLSTGMNRNGLLAAGLAAGFLISWLLLPGLLDNKDQAPHLTALEQNVESESRKLTKEMAVGNAIEDGISGDEIIVGMPAVLPDMDKNSVSKIAESNQPLRQQTATGERSVAGLPESDALPVYRYKGANGEQSEMAADSIPAPEDTIITMTLPNPDTEENTTVFQDDPAVEALWQPEYIPEGFFIAESSHPTDKNYYLRYESNQGDFMTLNIAVIPDPDEKSPAATESSAADLHMTGLEPPLTDQSANTTSRTKENAGIRYQLELTGNLPVEELNKIADSIN